MELKEAVERLNNFKNYVNCGLLSNALLSDTQQAIDTVLEELNNRISKDELIKIGNIYKETIKKLNKKDDIDRIKTLNTRLEFIQELLLKELGNKE